MWFFVFLDCVEEEQQVEYLDDGQLQVGVLFWFSVFFVLGCFQQIVGFSNYDKGVVFQDYELWQDFVGYVCVVGVLDYIYGCCQQYVVVEGEDYG